MIIMYLLFALAFGVFLFFFINPYISWLECKNANYKISYLSVLFMAFRKSNHRLICKVLSKLKREEIQIDSNLMEADFLAGGNLEKVAEALILAKNKELEISFDNITAWDLAGKDPVFCVNQNSKNKIYNPFQ